MIVQEDGVVESSAVGRWAVRFGILINATIVFV